MPSARLTFPLVPRRRFVGISFGTMRSLRRGSGSDIAGSRPYRPGDDIDAIDWAASAKLSTAKGSDEFVVRERFAERAPKIVIVCDRRPEMSYFGAPLPWLDKPQAMRTVVELILASAGAAGGFVGYLDYADGDTHWRQPKGERKLIELRDERLWSSEYGGPPDWLERSLAHLREHPRAVGMGTFVFVLSDFIPPPSKEMWLTAVEHRWDLVPVVIQDPTWEQSFPDVSGLVVSLRDPRSGRVAPVRLRAKEAAARRMANEERVHGLLETFRSLDIDPILVSSSDPAEILGSFLTWSDLRRTRRVLGREVVSRHRVLVRTAAVGLTALVVVVFAWDRLSSSEPPSAERPAIEARTDLSPRNVFFGDTVSALVEVTLDRSRVDPESVRVEADFAPWKRVAASERVRRDQGTTTTLRFSYVLRCLGNRCVSTDEDLVILDKAVQTFGQARVTYAAPEGAAQSGRDSLRAPWPRLLVGARYSARDAQAAGASLTGWRADLDSMPAATYRMSPALLSALLLVGGALLASAGAVFAFRVRPRRRAPTLPETGTLEPVLTPLERALALLELTERVDGAADQRRALELVAAALAERGNPKLALASRALAWSKPLPAVADTNGLAVRARSALRNGAG